MQIKLICSLGLTLSTLAGCMAGLAPEAPLVQTDQGAVYLERVTGSEFLANHPAELEPTVIRRLLSGLYVEGRQGALTTVVFGQPQPIPVFTPKEAEFLTPHLLTAFRRATPRHCIGFRLYQHGRKGAETTAGRLYVEHERLFVTLTQYRVSIDSFSKTVIGPDADDPTGLNQRVVIFMPDVVIDPEVQSVGIPVSLGYLTTLAINYRRLARLPEDILAPKADASSLTKAGRTGEMETGPARLEIENQALRQKLVEREEELERLRAGKSRQQEK
jgi:hypothetical protein